MRSKEQMLCDIGIVSFVVVELVLFLDTHPGDTKAIQYFNHYNSIKQQMMKEFAENYYPLTLDSACPMQDFAWANAPLPWEVCA